METLVWDDSLLTGLGQVDEQHHELVKLFNQLNDAFFQRQDEGQDSLLEQVFERLIAYADSHFSQEEALMREQRLDPRHTGMHQRSHAQFVEQVRGMWTLRQSLRQPAETIIGFLMSWLALHIMGMDQSMARQMHLIADGNSPEQAYEQDTRTNDVSTVNMLKVVGNLYQVLAKQNGDLKLANEQLERRVRERTLALEQANADLQHANERLKAFSLTDGLLGIPNRKYFDDRLQEEWARALRQQQPLAVLMMDVDFFKRYNDCYGHPAGDACLKAVAVSVHDALHRETDFVARYGGEELAALLPCTDTEHAMLVAQRINQVIRNLALPHSTSSASGVVTLSIGVASAVPQRGQSAAWLLQQADSALYDAKHTGRDRCAKAPLAVTGN